MVYQPSIRTLQEFLANKKDAFVSPLSHKENCLLMKYFLSQHLRIVRISEPSGTGDMTTVSNLKTFFLCHFVGQGL